jgi:glycosyltransferase involved in cell wall biosynthesis
MSKRMRSVVVIPAFNEEAALPRVLAAVPRETAEAVIVVDNGSADGTAAAARRAGALVVAEPRRGYGRACLAGIAAAAALRPEALVFLDADHSDVPEEMPRLVAPIASGAFDLVIGSRVLGSREPGALLPQARAGNLLAVHLIRWLYGWRYTDLGPFRAIRWDSLVALGMRDTGFGWTVEMQVRAVLQGLRITEVPVSYRRRVGTSKITGTVRGTVLAGRAILGTILALRRAAPPPR